MIAASKLRYIDHPERKRFTNDEWHAIVEVAKACRDAAPFRQRIFTWIDGAIAAHIEHQQGPHGEIRF